MMTQITKEIPTVTGQVVSNRMDKTIAVEIVRKVPMPLYRKYVKRITKLLAHDEANQCQIGDTVTIKQSRPLSKRKTWVLVEVLEKANT